MWHHDHVQISPRRNNWLRPFTVKGNKLALEWLFYYTCGLSCNNDSYGGLAMCTRQCTRPEHAFVSLDDGVVFTTLCWLSRMRICRDVESFLDHNLSTFNVSLAMNGAVTENKGETPTFRLPKIYEKLDLVSPYVNKNDIYMSWQQCLTRFNDCLVALPDLCWLYSMNNQARLSY